MIKVELLRIIEIDKDVNYRNNLCFVNNYKNYYCTLRETIQLCNIEKMKTNGTTYLKFPKLSELHEKLFGITPNNLHNSLNDVLVTLRCFIKLKYNTDLYTICENYKNIVDNNNLV